MGDYKLRGTSFVTKTRHRNEWVSNNDPKMTRLFDILEKLVPRFEEMERIPAPFDLKEKQIIQGHAIIRAISSPDPVRNMTREVDSLRKGRSIPAMINCVAMSLGVSKTDVREILRNLIV
jgi:hypothetical protein